MTEKEGRTLANIKKHADPCKEWDQSRPHTYENSFGIVDENGQTIPKLVVHLVVFTSSRLNLPKFVLSLMHVDNGVWERAYQMEVNLRPGLTRDDHNYSHEHYGTELGGRHPADATWANASFNDALKRFCEKCCLTLENDVPDYREFTLK